MLGEEPFPEEMSSDAGGTSEPMLRKELLHRFGDSGVYRDVPFAVLFALQLLAVLVVAIANGLGVSSEPATAGLDSLRHDVRARQLILILCVTAITASVLATLWLVLLRSGAKEMIWIGACGSIALSLANGIALFVQGRAAGIFLGTLSLITGLGCLAFIVLNRQRMEFSAQLLHTVAHLTRDYPETIYVALGAAVVQLVWLFLWVTALSYTSERTNQAVVMVVLLLSFFWTSQLIKAIVHATVAGTVASWYFLHPNVPRNCTARSLRRALTTSFGSLCLGSLVAASLSTLRGIASSGSNRSSGRLHALCMCCLGFLDVLTRFFNEFAYTQVAIYGKTFTRASRDTWTLLVHHSGVDAIVQRDLISSALTLGALLSGLTTALVSGVWARAFLGDDQPQWWQAECTGFLLGYGCTMLVSTVIQSGTNALYVCYAEDPAHLAAINQSLYALFILRPHVPPTGPALGGSSSYKMHGLAESTGEHGHF
ncbi:hypothetical protein AB1Y20_001306 [Prymnesium parvum]|uniref:Choline transporter-like protein n=1 Tax=Prymnesium parvum TaxID=97485 RepID=A0AB34KC64_PRYPA|mmetsp:Transcript_9395/g.22701  ORF Transcript_9395/g.22701 Transcript_9395/m.22701 type:complete len:484 (-) Transcript_9395:74-1525(-)